jgi:AbiV family abortive infection protein
VTPNDILTNADRLIADAKYLHEDGRSRSAATLVVVALEQCGSFVEELAKEKFHEPIVHLGIFGKKANEHAKRQDALAAHLLNFTMTRLTQGFAFEQFFKQTGCGDTDTRLFLLLRTGVLVCHAPQPVTDNAQRTAP